MKKFTPPVVVYPGGLSHREWTLQRAREWQIAHPPPEIGGVQTPTELHLLVQDLVLAVLERR